MAFSTSITPSLSTLMHAAVAVLVFALAGCNPGGQPNAPEAGTTNEAAAAPHSPETAETDSGGVKDWTHETPVGRIVAEHPDTARVFELVGIDYCCDGHQTLADACEQNGTDPDALLAALLAVRPAAGETPGRSWINASLTELVDHIESTHHEYLRRELPRLAEIVDTVARVHADSHPELAEVKAVFQTLVDDIPPHLAKEEAELFPAARKADESGVIDEATRTLAAEIEADHDHVGAALHRLRELTSGFTVPADACALYKQMLAGLLSLEADMHAHVHKENNILLPRLTAR